MHQNCSGGLLKHRSLGPTLRVSASGGLGGDLGMCIFTKPPEDADAVGPGAILGEPLLWGPFHGVSLLVFYLLQDFQEIV